MNTAAEDLSITNVHYIFLSSTVSLDCLLYSTIDANVESRQFLWDDICGRENVKRKINSKFSKEMKINEILRNKKTKRKVFTDTI